MITGKERSKLLTAMLNKTLTIQDKTKILENIEQRVYSKIEKDCARWGISKTTYYRWKKEVKVRRKSVRFTRRTMCNHSNKGIY